MDWHCRGEAARDLMDYIPSKHRQKTADDLPRNLRHLAHIFLAFHSLERSIGIALSNRSKDFFDDVSLGHTQFLTMIDFAQTMCKFLPSKGRRYKFIDVGCGVGTKVFLATGCDFEAYGLEFNEKYCDIARVFNGEGGCPHDPDSSTKSSHIINENALEYKDYNKYDVVYYFNPIKNRQLEKEMEKHVRSRMKIPSFLLEGYRNNFDTDYGPLWCDILPGIKVKDEVKNHPIWKQRIEKSKLKAHVVAKASR